MATRWTIRHGLMLLWFKDLMDVTEKLVEEAQDRIVETLGL